ncbi:MAG: hypothetical protein JWR59_1550, partial [Brevundimonas sp.]|nr:hypothetical protein [Brevundimonas sp.]
MQPWRAIKASTWFAAMAAAVALALGGASVVAAQVAVADPAATEV